MIGIPMGWDPTPFFVTLFLHYYERRWISQLRKLDLRRFANVFRFIDNLTVINGEKEFDRSCKEIYSFELAPRKENIDSVL